MSVIVFCVILSDLFEAGGGNIFLALCVVDIIHVLVRLTLHHPLSEAGLFSLRSRWQNTNAKQNVKIGVGDAFYPKKVKVIP